MSEGTEILVIHVFLPLAIIGACYLWKRLKAWISQPPARQIPSNPSATVRVSISCPELSAHIHEPQPQIGSPPQGLRQVLLVPGPGWQDRRPPSYGYPSSSSGYDGDRSDSDDSDSDDDDDGHVPFGNWFTDAHLTPEARRKRRERLRRVREAEPHRTRGPQGSTTEPRQHVANDPATSLPFADCIGDACIFFDSITIPGHTMLDAPSEEAFINAYGLRPSTVLERSHDEGLMKITNILGNPTFEIERNNFSPLTLNATRKALKALQHKLLTITSTRKTPKPRPPKPYPLPPPSIRPIRDYLIFLLPEYPLHDDSSIHRRPGRRYDAHPYRPYHTDRRFTPEYARTVLGYNRPRPTTPPWTWHDHILWSLVEEGLSQRPRYRHRRRLSQRGGHAGDGGRGGGAEGGGANAERGDGTRT